MTYEFTDSAKNVIEIANNIASKLGHNFIGTEHILYGLTKELNGIASKILLDRNITSEVVLAQIEKVMGNECVKSKKILAFTPRTKKIFENASLEARKVNSEFIGTEHILIRNFKRGR